MSSTKFLFPLPLSSEYEYSGKISLPVNKANIEVLAKKASETALLFSQEEIGCGTMIDGKLVV
jgi:hypothetical protein